MTNTKATAGMRFASNSVSSVTLLVNTFKNMSTAMGDSPKRYSNTISKASMKMKKKSHQNITPGLRLKVMANQ